MDIKDLRVKIDEIDKGMVELFAERMDIASKIAEYKRETGMPVLDAARERQKLAEVADLAGDDMRDYVTVLYSLLFELS